MYTSSVRALHAHKKNNYKTSLFPLSRSHLSLSSQLFFGIDLVRLLAHQRGGGGVLRAKGQLLLHGVLLREVFLMAPDGVAIVLLVRALSLLQVHCRRELDVLHAQNPTLSPT